MEVRRLGSDDLHRMRQVNQLLADAFDDAERYAPGPSDSHLQRLLASDAFLGLAAIQDGAVIGALTAYELVKYERETRELYLYDIAVAVPFRRRGVATALIEEAQRVAAHRGAEILFVQADAEDAAAIALYKRFGDRRAVCHFDIAPRS